VVNDFTAGRNTKATGKKALAFLQLGLGDYGIKSDGA
jgi:hypothetical protein